MLEPLAQEVLSFWFGDYNKDIPAEKRRAWFNKDAKFDKLIEKKFSSYLDIAFMGALDRWALQPESLAALIIMLDQFPRNMFRGSYKAFHFDKKALSLSHLAIERRDFLKVPASLGYFMLMPTMHAENLEMQNLGIESFKELLSKTEKSEQDMIQSAIEYAVRHRDIIQKFGRFPHRNQVLERKSTPEETRFLKTPGSSF